MRSIRGRAEVGRHALPLELGKAGIDSRSISENRVHFEAISAVYNQNGLDCHV